MRSKNCFAAFLTFVMCANILQFTTFAAENGEGSETTENATTIHAAGAATVAAGTETDVEGNAVSVQTTEVQETVIEIMGPVESSSAEPAPSPAPTWGEWGDEPTGSEDPSEPIESPAPLLPAEPPAAGSGITVELDPGGEEVSAGVATLDWETFKIQLEETYDMGPGALSGLMQEDGSNVKNDNFEVTVSEGGSTVTVVEVLSEEIQLQGVDFGSDESVELTADDIPEGFEAVEDDDGNVTYQNVETVTNSDGSKTTTTTIITITKIRAEGEGTVIQTRTVKTTEFDLSNADLTLTGSVGQFEVTDTTPSEEGPISCVLEELIAKSGIEDLIEADALAVMDAVLNKGEKDNDWSEEARAFYEYLTLDSTPVITSATVVLNVEDAGFTNTASVSFTVEMSPSVTGDLLVNINTGDTTREMRLSTEKDALSDGIYDVTHDEMNGTYTFTIYNVQLSANTDPVNLTFTTAEAITQRTVIAVEAEAPVISPGEQVVTPDKLDQNDVILDKGQGHAVGNIQPGDSITYTSDGESVTVQVTQTIEDTYVFKNGGQLTIGGAAVEATPISETKGLSIANTSGKDIPIAVIAIKAGGGNGSSTQDGENIYYYPVPGGVLRAGQTINLDGVVGDNGGGHRDISHLALIGAGEAQAPIAYSMTETTQPAAATLNLNLTGGTITASDLGEKSETRNGTAIVIQTSTTIQQIVTERTWNSTEPSQPAVTPEPTPPPTPPVVIDEPDVPLEELPDPDVPLSEIPDVDIPDEGDPLPDIPDEDVPLTDIPDEDVPLANISDEDVPLANISDEDVPLADVPLTGGGISLVWYAAAALSAAGLTALTMKKRDEKET